MIMVYDDCMKFMILTYDGCVLRDNQIWYIYTRWFDQTVGLTCHDRKYIGLQVYLVDKLTMRYDFSLFKFVLSLMGIKCLLQEWMNILGWVVKTNYKN